MFSKANCWVKAFAPVLVMLFSSCNLASASSLALIDFAAKGADTLGATIPSTKMKAGASAISYLAESAQASASGASGSSLAETALTMSVSAIGARYGAAALAGFALTVGLPEFAAAGAYLAGAYVGDAALSAALEQWKKNFAAPISVAANGDYPFLGHWASVTSGNNCSSQTFTYTRNGSTDSADADDHCKFRSIKAVSASDFSVAASCNDPSGDGPSTFNVTWAIRMIDQNTIDVKPGKDPANRYTRCPQAAPPMKMSVAPTPAPPPLTPSVAPASSGAAILAAIIAGDEQALKVALRTNLPGYNCGAEGTDLVCQNGSLTVKASIQARTVATFSEFTANPERFPQGKVLAATLDRLGVAIGLAPTDILACRNAQTSERVQRKGGFMSYCAQQTKFAITQLVLGIKKDTSF